MRLARKGDDLGGDNAPDNNADTIALFGSGMLHSTNIEDESDRIQYQSS